MTREEIFTALLESRSEYAILVLDPEGKTLLWNAGAARILKLDDEEPGREGTFMDTAHARKEAISEAEMQRALAAGSTTFYRSHLRTDASQLWAEGSISPLFDGAGSHIGYLKIFADVSSRRRFISGLLHMAKNDALTGLGNRASFNEHFREWIASARRNDTILILHLLDLDYFKQVNDSLGHAAGDALLQQVAKRLGAATRASDFVARLGGDEFAILQAGPESALAGQALAEKVVRALGEPYLVNESEIHISASVGLAVLPDDGATPDDLFRRADAALYRTKHTGRNGFSFFTAQLDREAHDRSDDLTAIRQAVAAKQFHMVYQPKVCAANGRVVAMEALLRADHPRFAGRPIMEVLKFIREGRLMNEMCGWILNSACRDASQWRTGTGEPMKMCVNFGAQELSQADVMDLVDSALGSSGLAAADLIIELTEQAIFDSDSSSMAILEALSQRGVLIALDDFGTGYSALNYLTTLPISVLKLDMSIIRKLSQEGPARNIVRAIISLAHSLGILVVAEGVESAEQYALLREESCDELQGFLFSPPLEARQMTQWLATHGAA